MLKTLITTGLIAGAALGLAPAANAVPDVEPLPGGGNCQVVLWGFLGSQRRAICDLPVQADGSWWRRRVVATPAHHVSLSFSCSGGTYSSYCTSYGGYDVPFSTQDDETYVVTPDTVLPDEPGHMGAGPAPTGNPTGIQHGTIA